MLNYKIVKVRDLMSNNVQESMLKVRENERIGYYGNSISIHTTGS